MKLRSAIVCLILLPAAAEAGETVAAKYAGEFLALGVGGRALGMGGAFVALANDVTAGYWNPAGLSRIEYPEFTLMHSEQFAGLLNHDYGAAAIPFGPNASLGFSVIRLGVDDIPNTQNAGLDANGNVTYDPNQFTRIDPNRVTYFSAADWAFFFTYSKKQSETFSYGANVKFIRRELDTHSATGVGVDLGLWYAPFDRLVLGANVQDITTTFIAWDTGLNELITPTMKVGTAYFIDLLGGRIAPAMDFDVRFENRQYASMAHVGPVSLDIHSGMEFQYKDVIALRAGYSDTKQIALGAGVHLPKLNIDYSFSKLNSLDQYSDTHRISLTFTLEADQFKRIAE